MSDTANPVSLSACHSYCYDLTTNGQQVATCLHMFFCFVICVFNDFLLSQLPNDFHLQGGPHLSVIGLRVLIFFAVATCLVVGRMADLMLPACQ
jgi:hypothetical protein